MDKTKYITIDLHQHSKYSYEAPEATLSVKDLLEYYRQLAETKFERVKNDNEEIFVDKKVAFSITDHDSSEGAYYAWKRINEEPEKYKNIEFIPGIEINVDCGRVLTYPDKANNDEKYVFKSMHLLAHAKPGREKEFFKRTRAISLLNKMVMKENNPIYDPKIVAKSKKEKQTKYISIGGQILSARNLIAETCKIKIPYDCYLPCVKEGASYSEIRDIFIDETYKYICSHSNYFYGYSEIGAKAKISEIISKKETKYLTSYPIFPAEPQIIKDLHNLNKIDILEIPKILGDCATTCFAHPYTIRMHKFTEIPVKNFLNVDYSMLPDSVKNRIRRKLNDNYELTNGSFSAGDIMIDTKERGYSIRGDEYNLVMFQIFYNNLLKKGVKVDGFEIQRKYVNDNFLQETLDVVMDKYNFAISFGSDIHYNEADKYFFKPDEEINFNYLDGISYFDRNPVLCTESSYFKLNRSGKQKLNKEENNFSVKYNSVKSEKMDDYKYDMDRIYFATDCKLNVHAYCFNNDKTKFRSMDTGAIYNSNELYQGDDGSINTQMLVNVACKKEYGSCVSKLAVEEVFNKYAKKLYPEIAQQFKNGRRGNDKKFGAKDKDELQSFDFHQQFGFSLTNQQILDLLWRYEDLIQNNNKMKSLAENCKNDDSNLDL
ncbi:MAG: PHP domain-containing protein [Christensenellales bacterium]